MNAAARRGYDAPDVLRAIEFWVWSGFHSPETVMHRVRALVGDNAGNAFMNAVNVEFERKRKQQASWPEHTDCDLVDRSFEELNSRGILALQTLRATVADAEGDVAEALSQDERYRYLGYCFYTEQDVRKALCDHSLSLVFGNLVETTSRLDIGIVIHDVLRSAGLNVVWNGDPEKRIAIAPMHWKRHPRACTTSLESFLRGACPRPKNPPTYRQTDANG